VRDLSGNAHHKGSSGDATTMSGARVSVMGDNEHTESGRSSECEVKSEQ
jgi:hypothetical protein